MFFKKDSIIISRTDEFKACKKIELHATDNLCQSTFVLSVTKVTCWQGPLCYVVFDVRRDGILILRPERVNKQNQCKNNFYIFRQDII